MDEKQIVWYGPHACAVCGVEIVKASAEDGGAEFEPPERLMRVFYRGSESRDPNVAYPMVWTPHVHNPSGSPLMPTASAPPTSTP